MKSPTKTDWAWSAKQDLRKRAAWHLYFSEDSFTLAEIAVIMGITRQRVYQLATSYNDEIILRSAKAVKVKLEK